MAAVGSYMTRAGLRWRVRYRTPDLRQTDKRGFVTKRDARTFAANIEVRKATGEFVPISAGNITLGEVAPTWLDKKKQSTAPSHYRTLESAWRTHVGPVWATRRIADITTTEVEAWISRIVSQRRGVTTVRRAHSVLSGILADAVKGRRLVANPAQGVDNLPRPIRQRHTYLSASEVHALAAETGDHRVLVLLLAFCGLRWGEAIALRYADVDFLRRRIAVATNAVQLGGVHHVGPTKDRKSRSVPVPGFVLDELCRLCADKDRDDLIFPRPHGSASKAHRGPR